MMKTLRVGLVLEPAGWHLNGVINTCALHDEIGEVAIADATGQTFGKFHPLTGSSSDPHWRTHAHEPGSGPPPTWQQAGAAFDTPAALGDKLQGTFTDHRKMLAEFKPDLVIVTLEPTKMPPVLTDCLEAGAHVLHEKPACVRIEDYRAVVKVARQHQRHLGILFGTRGQPNVREAREIIRRGELGDLFAVQAHYVAEHPRTWLWKDLAGGWMMDRSRGGGHLMFLGCHYLDAMRYLTGADVTEVTGFTDVVGGEPIDAEDAYALSFRFSNGMIGSMTGGFLLEGPAKQEGMTIYGRHGWLRLDPEPGTYLEWFSRQGNGRGAPHRRIDFTHTDVWSSGETFKREFYRACLGDGEPPIAPEDGLWMHEIGFAAREASATGRTQKVVLGG